MHQRVEELGVRCAAPRARLPLEPRTLTVTLTVTVTRTRARARARTRTLALTPTLTLTLAPNQATARGLVVAPCGPLLRRIRRAAGGPLPFNPEPNPKLKPNPSQALHLPPADLQQLLAEAGGAYYLLLVILTLTP